MLKGKFEMYQEIDIKLKVAFLEPQLKKSSSILDEELKKVLTLDFPEHEEPILVEEIETSTRNAHLRLRTAVDSRFCDEEITNHIIKRVKELLPMGTNIVATSFREEAEIYGNK